MLVYLDSNVVIYLIEQTPIWGTKATAHIGALRANQDHFALSDLTRLECRVRPLAQNDRVTLTHFEAFFQMSDVSVLALSPVVCDRAAMIRARHRYRLADSLHLAAAVEAGCDVFLTNDTRLAGFPDIAVEVLPP